VSHVKSFSSGSVVATTVPVVVVAFAMLLSSRITVGSVEASCPLLRARSSTLTSRITCWPPTVAV
jgi:hypothetical protein